MDNIKLNARQINWINSITADRLALDITLQVAMQYHANATAEKEKEMQNFWNEIYDTYGLDSWRHYRIDRIENESCIVLVDETEAKS